MRKYVSVNDDMLRRIEERRDERNDATTSATIKFLIEEGLKAGELKSELVEMERRLNERIDKFEHSLRKDNDSLLSQSADKLSAASKKISGTTRQATLASQVGIATMLMTAVFNINFGNAIKSDFFVHKGMEKLDLNEIIDFFLKAGGSMAYDRDSFKNIWAAMRDVESAGGETLADVLFGGDSYAAEVAVHEGVAPRDED